MLTWNQVCFWEPKLSSDIYARLSEETPREPLACMHSTHHACPDMSHDNNNKALLCMYILFVAWSSSGDSVVNWATSSSVKTPAHHSECYKGCHFRIWKSQNFLHQGHLLSNSYYLSDHVTLSSEGGINVIVLGGWIMKQTGDDYGYLNINC